MPPAEFDAAIPVSYRLHSHALDSVTTSIGNRYYCNSQIK